MYSLQADNTVRENKNQILLKYLCYLVGSGAMRLVSFMSARVGHTHNRLDALYGVLSRAMKFVDRLIDLEDVRRILLTVLQ